jgi:hypothetical protein
MEPLRRRILDSPLPLTLLCAVRQSLPRSSDPSLTPWFTVIVVGAGLGGCATAIALHRHGHEVVAVLDKVREFNRLGDSLGLGENAYKLLSRWVATSERSKTSATRHQL